MASRMVEREFKQAQRGMPIMCANKAIAIDAPSSRALVEVAAEFVTPRSRRYFATPIQQ